MSIEIARNFYLNPDPAVRLNCAQAVLKAFQEEMGLPDQIIEDFKAFGGGRAAFGHCGAVFAADFILGMAGIEHESVNVVAHIESLAGSAKCEEIKSLENLSCLGCVEACVTYVRQILDTQFDPLLN